MWKILGHGLVLLALLVVLPVPAAQVDADFVRTLDDSQAWFDPPARRAYARE